MNIPKRETKQMISLNGRRLLLTLLLKMESVLTRLVPPLTWMATLPKMLTSFSPETGEKGKKSLRDRIRRENLIKMMKMPTIESTERHQLITLL